ncbi:hypothetical protein [Actinomadura geliboluensis]|uniref:hypothetical protein n=1 Tax=Actinomadura geliboluensis TaxID=882440 RepID=UPI0036953671
MPYTRHGHWHGPAQPAQPASPRSDCGGPDRCPECIADASADLLGAVTGRIAATTAALRDALDREKQLADALKRAEHDRDENARRLAAFQRVKTWRNEDGRAFVFVDDLLAAIGYQPTGQAPR